MDNKRVGLGLADVLTIVFVVLKLIGIIEWSWFWVLSPVLISVILVLVIWGIYAIINK